MCLVDEPRKLCTRQEGDFNNISANSLGEEDVKPDLSMPPAFFKSMEFYVIFRPFSLTLYPDPRIEIKRSRIKLEFLLVGL